MIGESEAASSLAGKRIVVTRAAHQADGLDDLLQSRGAVPLHYPCIAIAPPEDIGPLDAALRGLVAGDFDWLVLTSRNTVTVLAERLRDLGLDSVIGRKGASRRWASVSVAAVGAATAEAIERELGLPVDLAPEEFVAEALASALTERLVPGQTVLLCQGDLARPVLVEALNAAGAVVTSIVAYRTVVGSGGVDLPALLAERRVDAITFTSSSTVRNLLQRLQVEGGDPADLAGVCLACLGPITASTARGLGLTVHVTPPSGNHTLSALVDALEDYFVR